jgi:hypothetical protein
MRAIVLLLCISGCTVSQMSMHHEQGCWKEKGDKVCGEAVSYLPHEEAYVMQTPDGWKMKVPAANIEWKQ